MQDDDRDDDEVGKPVEALDKNDPLNKTLGAFQLLFMQIHETALEFLDAKLRKARDLRQRGWLDVRFTIVGDKLVFNRHVRAMHERPPRGRWWTMPLLPNVLDELLERIKPAPPEEPKRDVEIDASAEQPPADPHERARGLVAQRAAEAHALAHNIRRTFDELNGQQYAEQLQFAALTVEQIREALEKLAVAMGTTLQ